MTLPLLTDQKESPGITFAEPDDGQSFASSVGQTVYKYGYGALVDPLVNPQAYKDVYTTAERSTRLTGNMVSESAAREEAYDRRIAAVKKATGIELENPERGGYAIDARKAIRDEVRAGGLQPIDAKGGVPEYQKRVFDQNLAALQKDHPDLDFGDVDTEARTLAKGAADAAAKAAADVNPIAALATGFAGGLVGSRRDPLFIGSMFAGPTSAVGRTAFARIASSSLFTGLFNAGISAVEQPTVQDWRGRIGMESGVIPALHDVGLAFVLGMIPGALIQGGKEAFSAPLRRVLAGHPEPGDIEAVHAGLTPAAPREAAALAAGAESTAADRATLTIPEPKSFDQFVKPAGMSEREWATTGRWNAIAAGAQKQQLHDDMLAAALKRADDQAEPSPEAVAAVRAGESRSPDVPPATEIEQRIAAAAPKSEREAIAAADEALDDIGRRESMAALRGGIDAVKAEEANARTARLAESEPPKIPAKDPIGKIPWIDDSGNPKLLTTKAAAAIGERDDLFAMLVRSCK